MIRILSLRGPLLTGALFLGIGCRDATEPAEASIEATTFAPSLNVDLSAMTRTPNGVYVRDITVGTGAVVAAGQEITVRYTGWLSNGGQFDATGPTDPPAVFFIGRSQVIAGWDDGVPGMRVGGVRQLVIPPRMGYGASGFGPIPGNAILVFRIEMVSAR